MLLKIMMLSMCLVLSLLIFNCQENIKFQPTHKIALIEFTSTNTPQNLVDSTLSVIEHELTQKYTVISQATVSNALNDNHITSTELLTNQEKQKIIARNLDINQMLTGVMIGDNCSVIISIRLTNISTNQKKSSSIKIKTEGELMFQNKIRELVENVI